MDSTSSVIWSSRAVDVGVVLGERADPQQAVEHPLALVARDEAELGQAQRQVAVGAALRPVDEAGARAVHRLQREAALLAVLAARAR